MATGTFYFVMHPGGDRSAVQVVDLSHNCSYERSEWLAVDDINFNDRDKAIVYARGLAQKYGLRYELFDSRYDERLNERLTPY